MGRDKFENEELIAHGLPTDVWFHVDALSSAHVYLRLPKGMTVDDIPKVVISDCSQLVKANSIEGCKKSSVRVVYTMWNNLKKTKQMADGQVSFHDNSQLRYFNVESKQNDVVNRINKTKVEKETTIIYEMEAKYNKEQQAADKLTKQQQAEALKQTLEEQRKKAEMQSYAAVMQEEQMTSNVALASSGKTLKQLEDDFM